MNAFAALLAASGSWTGTNRLRDPHAGIADDSPAGATVTPVLGGRFVRLDYTWSYRGGPQEGSYLIGHDPATGVATAYWIDSWHTGREAMACRGTAAEDGAIDVAGSYPVPPGPDWGWRTRLEPGDSTLTLTMWNVTPDGQAEVAVVAKFTRD